MQEPSLAPCQRAAAEDAAATVRLCSSLQRALQHFTHPSSHLPPAAQHQQVSRALPASSLSLQGHMPFLPSLPMDALFLVEELAILAWWCRKLMSLWASSTAADPWSPRVKLCLSQRVFSLRLSFGFVVRKRLSLLLLQLKDPKEQPGQCAVGQQDLCQ